MFPWKPLGRPEKEPKACPQIIFSQGKIRESLETGLYLQVLTCNTYSDIQNAVTQFWFWFLRPFQTATDNEKSGDPSSSWDSVHVKGYDASK